MVTFRWRKNCQKRQCPYSFCQDCSTEHPMNTCYSSVQFHDSQDRAHGSSLRTHDLANHQNLSVHPHSSRKQSTKVLQQGDKRFWHSKHRFFGVRLSVLTSPYSSIELPLLPQMAKVELIVPLHSNRISFAYRELLTFRLAETCGRTEKIFASSPAQLCVVPGYAK
jgi:hypothetical protein